MVSSSGGPSVKKGRPNKSYCIKDAVKLVSGSFAIIGQSLPCSVRIFQRRSIISGGRTFAFYTHFVLIIFRRLSITGFNLIKPFGLVDYTRELTSKHFTIVSKRS
jgi:hypothetical protein